LDHTGRQLDADETYACPIDSLLLARGNQNQVQLVGGLHVTSWTTGGPKVGAGLTSWCCSSVKYWQKSGTRFWEYELNLLPLLSTSPERGSGARVWGVEFALFQSFRFSPLAALVFTHLGAPIFIGLPSRGVTPGP
jgi:hypothetical protein